ncbi:MAG: gamma-glutamyltransferase family protein, partial [Reyranellaceae bacterium]
MRALRPMRLLLAGMLLALAASQAVARDARVQGATRMVAAANPVAAQAGLDVLRQGGSAIDAAIAVQMALNVVEPQASGIGGGGLMLYFDAANRRLHYYDGRETAPAGATAGMFLGEDGKPLPFMTAVNGGQSVGVPGLLRLLELAHARHGRRPWNELFAPAIALAENGTPVPPRLAGLLQNEQFLKLDAQARAVFYRADGSPLQAGEPLVQKELAATLRLIAREGADAFYAGPLADAIVARVRSAERRPGTLGLADLAGYKVVEAEALCGPYRLRKVCAAPPVSSGGLALLQMLGMLERFELAALEPTSPQAAHLLAEASRLAFADREAWVGDPAFVEVPTAKLLAADYLAARAAQIDPRRAHQGKAPPGKLA